eukprot:TRINITY_DN492_c0_g1_i4.p1 TRINITY_DN492_c0_g1~~TRINITY_DN492_c0_g1_i4.p1  ORF type:complete len:125 (+),score=4.48 TRINITY_DN492_c0_g1_i4:43-375(+)
MRKLAKTVQIPQIPSSLINKRATPYTLLCTNIFGQLTKIICNGKKLSTHFDKIWDVLDNQDTQTVLSSAIGCFNSVMKSSVFLDEVIVVDDHNSFLCLLNGFLFNVVLFT